MHQPSTFNTTHLILLTGAGLCLTMALAIAWVLGVSLFFPNSTLAGHLIERDDVIRAHIDYLMMAQFLLIFFLAFRLWRIEPPLWLVGACCFGGVFQSAGVFTARVDAESTDNAGGGSAFSAASVSEL